MVHDNNTARIEGAPIAMSCGVYYNRILSCFRTEAVPPLLSGYLHGGLLYVEPLKDISAVITSQQVY